MKVHEFYADFFDYLLDRIAPEDILAYNIPNSAKKRAEELLIFINTGNITAEERDELRHIREFDLLLAELKAKALARIDS